MPEARSPSLAGQLPRLMVMGLALGLALAGVWVALGGVAGLAAGRAYLTSLNQAYLVMLWAFIIRVAASLHSRPETAPAEVPGMWPAAAWMLGLAAVLLVWGGLGARRVVAGDWASLLALGLPMVLAAAGGVFTLWVLERWGGLREPVVPAVVFCLFALGLSLLIRVGAEMGAVGRREILSYLAWRHAAWFGVGLAAMAGTALLASPRRLARLARKKYLLPVGAAGLLVVTWLVGPEINGRRLWLVVGQMSLQTVEAVKLLMVLFVASYFSYEHPQVINGLPMGRRPGVLSVVGPYTLMLGLPLLALAVQKDFGPAVLIYTFFLVMLYLAAGSRWLVCGGLLAMVAAGAVGYWLHLPRMLHFRVRAWLDPFEASEHLTRGLWSLADGGLWGTGWGVGSPQTVPLSYSDFAFVSLAEELGFLGGAAVVALFLLLAWRGMVLAAGCRDPQDRLLAAGITVMITLQAVLVLGGVTGLIPLAGLTLPFVSHGGSSLVVNMIMAGLLIRIARDGPAS